MVRMTLDVLLFRHNMNQKELSEQLNIPKNTVGKYCNNTFTMINKDHIDSICNYFKCSISELIECEISEPINPNQLNMLNEIEESIKDQQFKESLKKTTLGSISSQDQETTFISFFDHFQNKMGNLTEQEIHTYAILLGDSPHQAEFSYADTVKRIKDINDQYRLSPTIKKDSQ